MQSGVRNDTLGSATPTIGDRPRNACSKKACELVPTGRLRDPETVKAEHEKAAAEYRALCAEAEEQRKADFRRRAREALRINNPDDYSELVDRVVAEMEWAANAMSDALHWEAYGRPMKAEDFRKWRERMGLSERKAC